MKKLLAAIAASMIVVSAFASPTLAGDKGNTGLSEYGTQAVNELASCLRTSDSLDVYYVIDNSTSLGGAKGTDPKNERASIIKQDIERWADIAALKPGFQLRIAGTLFNGNTTTISDWQVVSKETAKKSAELFVSVIKNTNLGPNTNWEAGLRRGFDELAPSDAGCKSMIWFTDGGIWPSGGLEARAASTFESIVSLCGPATESKIPTANSSAGLMSQIRNAQIRVFGILLHNGSDENGEPFYRSMMQPVIEETGSVAKVPGLPSGTLTCGENVSPGQRQYAPGAFLEAQSAANVAFAFMSIPAIVSGGSLVGCRLNHRFFVDPGIRSIEFVTDATSWTITDAEGKIRAQSTPENIESRSTERVRVPNIDSPEEWNFSSDGGKTCNLYLFPELYLDLHEKALIEGQRTSITGQFVYSLTERDTQPADLSVFKSAHFEAKVDGKDRDSVFDEATGSFEIPNYIPVGNQAEVSARLSLETQHYKLAPIDFEKSKEIFSADVLPKVGEIKFTSELVGVRKAAAASVTITPSDTGIPARVCFKKLKVIADVQNENAGKATDRLATWDWKKEGLDVEDCIDILSDTNRAQIVNFQLSNSVQADSKGLALFEYTITAIGEENLQDIPDSQTAEFETKKVTSKPLFFLWFILLMFFGLAVPFGILTLFNLKNSRLSIGNDLVRGEFKVKFDRESKSFSVGNSSEYFANGEVLKAFLPVSAGSSNPKRFTDPVLGVVVETGIPYESLALSAKAPLWPLALPSFSSQPADPAFTFVADASEPMENGVQSLRDGKLASLSYLTFKPEQIRHAKQFGEPIQGTLVVFSNRSADVLGADLNNRLMTVLRDSVLITSTTAAVDSIEVEVVAQRTDGGVDFDFDSPGSSGGSTGSDLDISFD